MKVAHVLQAQDIAMLAAVHKKIGSILDSVNGKAVTAETPAPKKRGPKPGSKKKKAAAATGAKKYDPTTISVAPAPDVTDAAPAS